MDVVDGMRIILIPSIARLLGSLSLRYYAKTMKERGHDQLIDLARTVWNLSALVVDATGVEAGLTSFLADQLGKGPRRVVVDPFVFTGKSKSDLGWGFVGLIDGGRIKEYADDGADITRIYRHQLAACTFEVLPGPGKLLRWSVPVSRGHDDLLISTALTARLDAIDWRDRTARGSGQS